MRLHLAIGINNTTTYSKLIDTIIDRFSLNKKQLFIYDKKRLDRFIDEEAIHDDKTFINRYGQSLQSMSSGQQKIYFVKHLLDQNPHTIILDNPLSHLDPNHQNELIQLLEEREQDCDLIFILNRSDWIPFYCTSYYNAFDLNFEEVASKEAFKKLFTFKKSTLNLSAILPSNQNKYNDDRLIELKNVNVSYGEKKILNSINWTIKSGEFWELRGPNGAGKSTILTMISGENPKAYGQDIYLFGYKKGSGETVWDIKKHIGYFTPSMTAFFKGYHSVKEMIIGGLKDSVGLYIKTSKLEEQQACYWIDIIGMHDKIDTNFVDLSLGEQCLVMTARAMIKNPKLLILDEPTAGLDQKSNELFIQLVNTIAKEHQTAIIYVSHKREPSLAVQALFELIPGKNGSSYTSTKYT